MHIWWFHQEKMTQSTQDGNLVKVFSREKGKMANVMLKTLDIFSFTMSSDARAFKVHVYASDFKFWNWSKWILVVDIPTPILLTILLSIHTLRIHYAHAAANLNSGYSKYAKVARVHYFCTIALRTSPNILLSIHTLRVHYAHAAANLNSGYSKYAKVAHVHYFCTIALRTSHAVPTRAWASRRVDLRERRVDLFFKRVIIQGVQKLTLPF